MHFFSGLRATLLPLCGLFLLCGSARAATYTGNSATGYDNNGVCGQIVGNNSFDDPRNWGGACAPGTVPGPGETVNISGFGVSGTSVNVGTLNLASGGLTADSITTDNLIVNNGTVAGRDATASTLRVNNSVDWTWGVISTLNATFAPTCNATISVDYNGAGSGSFYKRINGGAVINNQGTLNWSGSSIDSFGGGGGTINNSGTFNLLGDGLIGDGSAGTGIGLINSGTMNKIGGSGSTGIGSGSFTSNGGTLAAQTGVFNVSGSYSTTTLNNPTIGIGNGEVEIAGATLSGNFAVNGTASLNGTSAGTATFSGPGRLDWRSGGFDGTYIPTAIIFAPGFRADMTGTGTKKVGSVTNKGLITWSAGGELSGAMRNEGTFNFLTDGALGGTYSGFSVVNTGTLAKTGGSGVLVLGASVLDNSGIVDIQSGTIELTITPNGAPHHLRDGSLIKGAGKLLAFEPVYSDGTITVDGNYYWGDDTGGVVAVVGGTYKGNGRIEWKGGTVSGVTFAPGFTVNVSGGPAKGFSNGTPYGSNGESFNQGTLNWKGGTGIGVNGGFTNSGTFNCLAAGTSLSGPINNTGTFNTFAGDNTLSIDITNGGTINVGTAIDPSGIGILRVSRLVQTASGTLNLNLASADATTGYSQLISSSGVAIDGTLALHPLSGFAPQSSDVFTILKVEAVGNKVDGTFANVTGTSLSNGRSLKVNYNNVYPSASVTLQLAPPAAPSISAVNLSTKAPKTNDKLKANVAATDADGKPLTYSFAWKKTVGSTTTTLSETSNTLDLAVTGNGDKGNIITVSVVASNGTLSSDPVSASATIQNSAPIITKVALNTTAPKTNQILKATVTASDADNDALTYSYVWTRDDVVIPGATTDTLDLSKPGQGDVGQKLRVTVVANDGTLLSKKFGADAKVVNTYPTISVSLTPTSPLTKTKLTATVLIKDDDATRPTVTFEWSVIHLGQTSPKQKNVGKGTSATYDLSQAGYGDKGDIVTLLVTVRDIDTDFTKTATVRIGNSTPVIQRLTLSPLAPDTNTLLRANAVVTDGDNDPLFYFYQWTRNGQVLAGQTGATLNLVGVGLGDAGDTIGVSAYASDGTFGSSVLTTSVKVASNSARTAAGAPPVPSGGSS